MQSSLSVEACSTLAALAGLNYDGLISIWLVLWTTVPNALALPSPLMKSGAPVLSELTTLNL
jgi:hypothetical protein